MKVEHSRIITLNNITPNSETLEAWAPRPRVNPAELAPPKVWAVLLLIGIIAFVASQFVVSLVDALATQ